MGYRKIVVGTDGSRTAGVAQAVAVQLAKRYRAELFLVCAYQPPKLSRPMVETAMSRAAGVARRSRVEPTLVLEPGDATELILAVAEQEDADLIVVGNKGMGEATRFRLGSIPDQVAHRASCDVLIADTTRGDQSRPRPDKLYRKILAGTDGSPTAGEAARKAMELAMQLRAEVILVFVGDPIVGAIMLEQTQAAAPEAVKTHARVVQGEPAAMLVEVAKLDEADLLVVGNKGMAGARRYFLASVPNEVAHTAPVDVLIAKTVDRSSDDLASGHGGVVDYKGERLAVFKDEAGELHVLSPRCTHMGCTVDWNDADKTWDCPCHGSRYDIEGQVLEGPAPAPLAKEG
jgi:nucleotide-binding universal stress UspA family protein/nitrite reductase/ring-hydroxylating ferredoxin subunit